MLKILKTTDVEIESELNKVLNRSSFDNEAQVEAVAEIWDNVKTKGDQAIFEYTARFDQVDLKDKGLEVQAEEIEAAYKEVDDKFLKAIRVSIKNVSEFHSKQLQESWMDIKEDGVILGQKFEPLEKVGIYVPGGSAPLVSSVVMNGAPAKVAGVKEIIMVTPPSKDGGINPYTLVTAAEVGVDRIYKVGGAQAIAGLALGTETMTKVDKIVGPGNIYVTLAKKMAFGYVDIDMLAGPSEVLVLADESANPRFVAADLLSQAEHDPMASSILVTTSSVLAKEVNLELEKQLAKLSRQDICKESLENYGAILVAQDLEEAIDLTNQFAPEHLEVKVDDPFAILGKLKNAGAIFMGEYAAEPIGDYIAGPNHVLPTGGSARFYSPLNIDDFRKKSSIIYYTKAGLEKVKDDAVRIAEVEGLDAHANSIKVRFEGSNE
ncbi:histidinol dehydrogenase [Orenia metallireducens]|uniref:Histidinol dehydrogenase n=1 Tax=Orenia metallireducens TaxID=1413210 RepID=A0A285GPY6_9FIRM|nr:histidinol dehydrogenase [Orenia metallireducens]PRX29894.1 histidinol dehydrogenase [Orenia metallireducens]SNY25535.1 histidinol dehydrogenase [Orenia metallireducens]